MGNSPQRSAGLATRRANRAARSAEEVSLLFSRNVLRHAEQERTASNRAFNSAEARYQQLYDAWNDYLDGRSRTPVTDSQMNAADSEVQAARRRENAAVRAVAVAQEQVDLAEVQLDISQGGPGISVFYADRTARPRVESTLGRVPSSREMASLVGAKRGDRIAVNGDGPTQFTVMKRTAGGGGSAELSISKLDSAEAQDAGLPRGALVAHVAYVSSGDTKSANSGVSLVQSIRALSTLGVQRIYAHAAGSALSRRYSGGMNGYDTWARLGGRGTIPTAIQGELRDAAARGQVPAHWDAITRVEDLIDEPGGQQWWKQHGASFDVEMDTAPGGRTSKVLARIEGDLAKRAGRQKGA